MNHTNKAPTGYKLELIPQPSRRSDTSEWLINTLTCEVHTLLKVTNVKVCTKQQKARSRYNQRDEPNRRIA